MDAWTRHTSNRVGQQGRLCHRWWRRGPRPPPGRRDRRLEWADLVAAAAPATGAEVALVLPEATTRTMNVFLAEFSRSLPAGVHAVLALDRAGWHGAKALKVPANVTLVHLPPYSPELNPVERVWLYLRERFLSVCVFADHRAIVGACCAAWNRLAAEPALCSKLTKGARYRRAHGARAMIARRFGGWQEVAFAGMLGGWLIRLCWRPAPAPFATLTRP